MSKTLKTTLASLQVPLTQIVNVKDLAEKHNIHRTTATKYLRGEWSRFSQPIAIALIKDVLNVIKYNYGLAIQLEDMILELEEAPAPH